MAVKTAFAASLSFLALATALAARMLYLALKKIQTVDPKRRAAERLCHHSTKVS
jgi:hypothetical protein